MDVETLPHIWKAIVPLQKTRVEQGCILKIAQVKPHMVKTNV